MDILSLVLTLRPLAQISPEKPFPGWWGRAAHALLMKVVAVADPSLAEKLHNSDGPRPFTVSTLSGPFPDRSLDLQARYSLRLTALNAQMACILKEATGAGGLLSVGASIELDYVPFIVEAAFYNGEHPLASSSSYQELAGRAFFDAAPAPEVTFNFVSPVYFSKTLPNRIKNDLPYPVAEYVIGNLLERWNAFAPMAFPSDVQRYALESMVTQRFALRSRKVVVAGGVHVGSVGQVSFRCLNYDRYWMSLIHILASYALYAGVGAKTTMGLGQCRQPLAKAVSNSAIAPATR